MFVPDIVRKCVLFLGARENGKFVPKATAFVVTSGSVIVWDLETVPDLRGFAVANDLVGKTDVEVREVIGDKFPKHIYHSTSAPPRRRRIVCIGALVARAEGDHWAVDALGAPSRRRENRKAADICLR
jgi:hypothetical protein